ALKNCLFNAANYAPPGSEVRVVVAREGRHATVAVIDRGIGIPKREQGKIFEEYYRGTHPEVRNREGTGLGLALVKNVVVAHKGRVAVKSEEGKGTEFRIELPIHEG
ncbi:MAG: ATP-binding protein, partial [Deltaproteobacteria bacterium]|nr:ATP-binding protein [Deltaproteobacteria bacterium]